jgi:phi LC3 family holin
MKNIGKRLKNRGTLIALGSQLIIIISILYFYLMGEIIPVGLVANLILLGGAVLVILTTLGILNDPTTQNKGFKDDKSKTYR